MSENSVSSVRVLAAARSGPTSNPWSCELVALGALVVEDLLAALGVAGRGQGGLVSGEHLLAALLG